MDDLVSLSMRQSLVTSLIYFAGRKFDFSIPFLLCDHSHGDM
jgi:hypothetical protein